MAREEGGLRELSNLASPLDIATFCCICDKRLQRRPRCRRSLPVPVWHTLEILGADTVQPDVLFINTARRDDPSANESINHAGEQPNDPSQSKPAAFMTKR